MLDDDYWMTAANIRPVLKIERNIVDVRAYAQHSFCFVPVVYHGLSPIMLHIGHLSSFRSRSSIFTAQVSGPERTGVEARSLQRRWQCPKWIPKIATELPYT
jgi:hypothetical protein